MRGKAQTGAEFLIISGIVLFLLTVFFLVINNNISERNNEYEALLVKNIALNVVNEISLAFESSEGYVREFQLPEKINGQDYEIRLVSGNVYVATNRNAISLSVKDVEGEIKKGGNKIEKRDGRVYLN